MNSKIDFLGEEVTNVINDNLNNNVFNILDMPKWLNLVSNEYYSASIFLALNEGVIELSILRQIFAFEPTTYIKRLIKYNVIKECKLPKQKREDNLFLIGLGNYHLKRSKCYRLTSKAQIFYMQPAIYNLIKKNVDVDYYFNIVTKRRVDINNSKSEFEFKRLYEMYQRFKKHKLPLDTELLDFETKLRSGYYKKFFGGSEE